MRAKLRLFGVWWLSSSYTEDNTVTDFELILGGTDLAFIPDSAGDNWVGPLTIDRPARAVVFPLGGLVSEPLTNEQLATVKAELGWPLFTQLMEG